MTDFDEIWQDNAHCPQQGDRPLKFRIFKIQDGGGHHLEKSQKSRYLRNSLTDLYEIRHDYAKSDSQLLFNNLNFQNA